MKQQFSVATFKYSILRLNEHKLTTMKRTRSQAGKSRAHQPHFEDGRPAQNRFPPETGHGASYRCQAMGAQEQKEPEARGGIAKRERPKDE